MKIVCYCYTRGVNIVQQVPILQSFSCKFRTPMVVGGSEWSFRDIINYTFVFKFWAFLHLMIVSSQLSKGSPPHRCCTTSHVLCRTIPSTPLSCLTSEARRSVRASRGKNLPEYGSNRSSTVLSRSCSFSSSLMVRSGSSGSGLAATRAQ